MLESIFSTTTASISLQNCLICMGVAVFLGILISFTHKLTSKTTPNFLLTLSILPVLVFTVILLVNGNLGTSLAVAGVFGLIKFRSRQGSSKEILSVFWAVAVGLALGMGYLVFSVILTFMVAILIFAINAILSKNVNNQERKLKIIIPENLDYNEVFDEIMMKYTEKAELAKVKTTNMGSMFELTYLITMKKNADQKEFIDEIRIRNGNMLVLLERPELSEEDLL
ncbi:MAG: DUF4956 domain-containing protein [Clostridia bacterium]|nr:DUF4956 domain-containing protein [Clostridia bacterium]